MSKFQVIVLGIFVICLIAGIVAFAMYKGGGSGTLPAITVWGTFPADTLDTYVTDINKTLSQKITVNYVQQSDDQFSGALISALARGQGPDAILIPADMILSSANKLTVIPYSAFPKRNFIDTYVNEASIYLDTSGILAIPFTIDPLMMYWNRGMFDAAGVSTYPHSWADFTMLNPELTVKDQNGNVRQSAVAMGTFSNMTNARELFGTLLLQTGNPVTQVNADGSVVSDISLTAASNPTPALEFFSQFVDPTSPNYSWNRSMLNDKTAFLSGTLATYFGFASELSDIRAKNPNINFDVAPIPQAKSGGVKATYGRMYGFSLLRSSAKANTAFQIVSILVSPQYLSSLSKTMYLPSVRLDSMSQSAGDQYMTVFDQQALISRTWIDADPSQSSQVLSDMVDYFTSGQKTSLDAIKYAGAQYDQILSAAAAQ